MKSQIIKILSIAILSIIALVILIIIFDTYSRYHKSQGILQGYTYIGGLEKEGGRSYEGYWIKNSTVYYVISSAYGDVGSVDPLIPQPDVNSFRVNDFGPFKKSLFAYDSEHLYYTSKLLNGVKPSGFQYLREEGDVYKNIEYFYFFKSGGSEYKILSNCSYKNIPCEPIKVAE